jgi:hypothetical protein
MSTPMRATRRTCVKLGLSVCGSPIVRWSERTACLSWWEREACKCEWRVSCKECHLVTQQRMALTHS